MSEIEIPMFDKGDIVKDKFGNLFVIEDLVSPQQLEQDTPEYDHMGYRLKNHRKEYFKSCRAKL